MADIEEVNYPSGGRRADSPVDIESRNEREGSRESDHDDRDRRRRGGGYERDLRRENRRYAPYPSQDERSGRRQSGSSGKECRVYVWNLPYNVKWQDLKDFMKTVGEVGHVDIIEDGHGKSKGCGIVEFRHKEDAEKAIKELHGTDFRGRSIHIREDRIEETQSERRRPTSSRGADSGNYGSNHSPQIGGSGLGNLTNLLGMGNLNFAQGLNYKTDPLSCTVFVSNLDYNVNWQKLKDTFRVAGNVIRADINLDSDHKSKGFGTVQFETATEAISAVYFIAMFHGQNLSGRAMSVRLDRNAPIMQQLSNAGMNNVNMGRTAASGAMNQVAVLQLLQSLQGLSQLAQLTSNLNNAGGGLGAALGSLTGGGNIAGIGATPGMADPSATNPLAALSGLGMLGNNLGIGGAGGGGGGGLGLGGGLGSLSQGDSGAPGKQVFVRNLPWRYTWQDLKDKFKGAGRVVRADIMTESGGRSKGCGTVMFETAEDAAHAISLFNGALIDGREIDVRMDRLG